MRVYVTKRLSIEPEYLYLRQSDNDQDQLFQPNVVCDFTNPRKRFVAYGIVGVGVLRHKGRFFGNDFVTGEPRVFDTSFTTWSASVGGGVKIFATNVSSSLLNCESDASRQFAARSVLGTPFRDLIDAYDQRNYAKFMKAPFLFEPVASLSPN